MFLQPYPPVTAPLCSTSADPPLATLSLDGKATGTFLVNTSAEISSLSASLAARLSVTPNPAVGSDGKPILVGGKQVPSVTLPQSNLNGPTTDECNVPGSGPGQLCAFRLSCRWNYRDECAGKPGVSLGYGKPQDHPLGQQCIPHLRI